MKLLSSNPHYLGLMRFENFQVESTFIQSRSLCGLAGGTRSLNITSDVDRDDYDVQDPSIQTTSSAKVRLEKSNYAFGVFFFLLFFFGEALALDFVLFFFTSAPQQ